MCSAAAAPRIASGMNLEIVVEHAWAETTKLLSKTTMLSYLRAVMRFLSSLLHFGDVEKGCVIPSEESAPG
jgi:hypothetical protein